MNVKGFITPTASPLEWVDAFRYLGGWESTPNSQSWKHHVSAKARAYIVLVCLHFETCSPVWTPYQRGAQDDLEKVKKCAPRWICVKWDNYCWSKTYEECHSDLTWATVHHRHLLLMACKINNIDCLQFEDYFCAILIDLYTVLYKFQS